MLEIGPRGIRYRVLRLHEVGFEQIEEVDLRTAWRTVNLCFRFRDVAATFSANVRHLDEAARALGLMDGRVPFSQCARHDRSIVLGSSPTSPVRRIDRQQTPQNTPFRFGQVARLKPASKNQP